MFYIGIVTISAPNKIDRPFGVFVWESIDCRPSYTTLQSHDITCELSHDNVCSILSHLRKHVKSDVKYGQRPSHVNNMNLN